MKCQFFQLFNNLLLYVHKKVLQHMNGSVTISTLAFRPIPDDDGTILKCEGSNPRLPNSALEDSLVLVVMCKYYISISISHNS